MTPHLVDIPVLETERLTLRAPTTADFPAWQAFAATGGAPQPKRCETARIYRHRTGATA